MIKKFLNPKHIDLSAVTMEIFNFEEVQTPTTSTPQTPIIGVCEDCNEKGDLIIVDCCSDYHVYGMHCCKKAVCKTTCTHTCTYCNTTNYISRDDQYEYDNYLNIFICFHCENQSTKKNVFYGDLDESCRRYCECGFISSDHQLNGCSKT